jgi:hypothetical protein
MQPNFKKRIKELLDAFSNHSIDLQQQHLRIIDVREEEIMLQAGTL